MRKDIVILLKTLAIGLELPALVLAGVLAGLLIGRRLSPIVAFILSLAGGLLGLAAGTLLFLKLVRYIVR
ncbi:MAG: hypothetical protein DRN96_07830 [Thermoproteota archaeon]|nr:MAG: hypothetical protein DRN96_07830 [Candidatus Korarchaeota archaeon]RLG56134.1 MAG: hypothetical protein DRN99_00575 [Candidatus Korarchaeota archaeon]